MLDEEAQLLEESARSAQPLILEQHRDVGLGQASKGAEGQIGPHRGGLSRGHGHDSQGRGGT
eukprot:1427427-Lingulodinium_polyedra.AAC.1